MTNEYAHGYLEDMQRILTTYRPILSNGMSEANGMAILALEKQMPREAICVQKHPHPMYACPACRAPVDEDAIYCKYCGQLMAERDSVNGEALEMALKSEPSDGKDILKEFSEKIKNNMLINLKSRFPIFEGEEFSEDYKHCETFVKQIMYMISVILEDYGIETPRNACNQFLAEKELCEKYGIKMEEE